MGLGQIGVSAKVNNPTKKPLKGFRDKNVGATCKTRIDKGGCVYNMLD